VGGLFSVLIAIRRRIYAKIDYIRVERQSLHIEYMKTGSFRI